MKRLLFFLTAKALALFFTACEKQTGTGTLTLSITDSPIDGEDVTGVFITITEIQVHTSDSGWLTMQDFEGPVTFNLLDLTRGESEMLGSLELEAGNYTQVRFMIDAPESGTAKPVNPGCYIEFTEGSISPLFVPGGSQSGFKGVGNFRVPVNGTVEITADFDIRKSVHMTGSASPRYILKPVIRLVVDNQAGAIRGNVNNIPEDTGIVIYAYEDGTYSAEEANDPADSTTSRFPGAASSDMVDSLGVYHIAYLAAGDYDLVVTSLTEDGFGEVLGIVENVAVDSRKVTKQDIDIESLK
jgi:hypothetical protein